MSRVMGGDELTAQPRRVMSGAERLKRVFSPPAEVSKHDTGLRFTDILFGFVISQLFLRLQNWGDLPGFVRWQLVVATTLVLGSWIGFRRSLNRSEYEVKFFNLPFFRFVLDQLMLILYFAVAVLTAFPYEGNAAPADLVDDTARVLIIVFGLYAAWDALGIGMGYAGKGQKYRQIDKEGEITSDPGRKDWPALGITVAGLAGLTLAYVLLGRDAETGGDARWFFVAATCILLGYRWVKEVKRSWQM